MSKTITVGISDLNIAKAPDILVTYALGSCVGICLYDPMVKLAGLSHIMLPSSNLNNDPKQAYRFADTAIVLLVKKMEMAGARSARNIAAVKETLAKLRIPIIADDTGKNYGRTLYFNAADGTMRIKSVNRGEWVW